MKKYFIATLSEGCPKNLLESSGYRRILEKSGFTSVNNMPMADVIILNTCGCLSSIQDRAKKSIDEARLFPGKKVIVAGCYPKIDKANKVNDYGFEYVETGEMRKFEEIFHTSLDNGESTLIDQRDLFQQPEKIQKALRLFRVVNWFHEKFNIDLNPLYNFSKTIMMSTEFSYINLGSGCQGKCTYCGVKFAIGSPKSQSKSEIIQNVENQIKLGNKNLWLLADDVGCWGSDTGELVPDLITEILDKCHSDNHLVINYFSPDKFKTYFQEMKRSLSDRRIIQICIPLQTGSQKVLKRMGRNYNIKEVTRQVDEVKQINPSLIVKTQIILGFPGESWRDFYSTLKAMSHFDGIGVNTYSRLKYTPAYGLKEISLINMETRKMITKVYVTLLHLRIVFNTILIGLGKLLSFKN